MDAPATPAPTPDPAPPAWGRAGWALVLGAFVVGFAQGPLAVVGWGLTHLPGDRVDGRFNAFVLEHGYRWLRGEAAAGFWDLPIFFPAPRVTAYSDAHLGSLPLYSVLRLAGLSAERAYQGWYLLPFALNYAAAAWAARRAGGGAVAAAACGAVFAFAATAMDHTAGHSQLGPRFAVPPAVLLAHHWLLAPTGRRFALLAACLVLQAYLTIYIAYYLGLLVLATWAATALLRRDVPWRLVAAGWWRWLLVAAVAAVSLAPLVRPYLSAAGDHLGSDPRWLELYTPTPWAWLLASGLHWQAGWMHGPFPPPANHPGLAELHLFPGWLPLVGLLAAAALARRSPAPSAVLAVAAVLVVLATTRVGGVCLYDPVFRLPGGGSIRVVARIVLVLLFPAGLAVGTLIEHLARSRWGVGAALVALTLADQALAPPAARPAAWAVYRTPVAGVTAESDKLVELVGRERPAARALFVFPRPGDGDDLPAAGVRQMDAAWAALRLGLPTVNGYSGYWPTGWSLPRDYDALLRWLPADRRAGLAVVGEPTADAPGNAAGRAAFGPLPWPE